MNISNSYLKKSLCIFYLFNTMAFCIISVIFNNIIFLLLNFVFLICVSPFLKKYDNHIINIILFIEITSILTIFILYYGYINLYGKPYYLGGSDDLSFELWAKDCLSKGHYFAFQIKSDAQYMHNNSIGYISFLSYIMRISDFFGEYHTLIPRIFNCFIYIYSAVMMFDLFNNNVECEIKYKKIFLLSIGILPNILFINSHVFRDTIVLFFIILNYYQFYNWKEKNVLKKFFAVFILTVSLYSTFWIRSQACIYIIFVVILNIYFTNRKLNTQRDYMKILSFVILAIGCYLFFGVNEIFYKYSSNYSEYVLSGSSGLSTEIFSLPIFPFGIVFRFLYGLIYPLPVGILDVFSMLNNVDIFMNFNISIGSIYTILLIPYLFHSLETITKEKMIFVVLFFSVIMTTFTFRHFLLIYPFLFYVEISHLAQTPKTKQTKTLFIGVFLVIFLGLLYLIIR